MKRCHAACAFLAGLLLLALPVHAQDGAGARLPAAPRTEPAPTNDAPEKNTSDEADGADEEADAGTNAAADDPDEADDQSPVPANPFADGKPAAVEASLSRALADPNVSFCKAHEAEQLADPLLCSLSGLKARQRCPALSQACQPSTESHHSEWGWVGALGGLGDVLFWVILGVGVGALLVALRRILGVARAVPGTAPVRADLVQEPEKAPRTPGEMDVARLWARAQESALAARFEDAVAAIQGALVHALRLSGKLSVSPAQTNGDYLRALREEPALQRTAREVFRAVEGVQFGGAPASGELYRELFTRVEPIISRALAAVLLLIVCFSQAGCSSSFGQDPEGSARGFGVLTRLLTDQHTRVKRRIRALNVIEPDVAAILVVGEQPDEAWAKLLGWVSDGGTLIVTRSNPVLEKATGVSFDSRDYAGRLELDPEFAATPLELSASVSHTLHLPTSPDTRLRTFATAEKLPYVIERQHGEGEVLFFADEAFLQNASLSVGDNAFFAVSLLNRPETVLELVGSWTGGGADSTLSAVKNAGMGPLLAQLCFLALLFGWHGGVAFGSRRDPKVERRRAFRDHVLALGDNYRRARATRFALATYGSWLIERLRDRLSFEQPIGLIELAGRVAARVPESESELVVLFAETREAQEDVDTARASPADLALLNKLETLALRVGGSK